MLVAAAGEAGRARNSRIRQAIPRRRRITLRQRRRGSEAGGILHRKPRSAPFWLRAASFVNMLNKM
jgi:hypothetical protein